MRARPIDPAGVAIAAIVLALAGLVVWDALTLELAAVYGPGPKAMPLVVAAGLGLLGLANLVLALRGAVPPREAIDGRAVLLILAGLLGLMGVLGLGGGFIPATALLFATTAAAFGRRAFLVDLVIGLALAAGAYLVFAKLLALTLPVGPLERLL